MSTILIEGPAHPISAPQLNPQFGAHDVHAEYDNLIVRVVMTRELRLHPDYSLYQKVEIPQGYLTFLDNASVYLKSSAYPRHVQQFAPHLFKKYYPVVKLYFEGHFSVNEIKQMPADAYFMCLLVFMKSNDIRAYYDLLSVIDPLAASVNIYWCNQTNPLSYVLKKAFIENRGGQAIYDTSYDAFGAKPGYRIAELALSKRIMELDFFCRTRKTPDLYLPITESQVFHLTPSETVYSLTQAVQQSHKDFYKGSVPRLLANWEALLSQSTINFNEVESEIDLIEKIAAVESHKDAFNPAFLASTLSRTVIGENGVDAVSYLLIKGQAPEIQKNIQRAIEMGEDLPQDCASLLHYKAALDSEPMESMRLAVKHEDPVLYQQALRKLDPAQGKLSAIPHSEDTDSPQLKASKQVEAHMLLKAIAARDGLDPASEKAALRLKDLTVKLIEADQAARLQSPDGKLSFETFRDLQAEIFDTHNLPHAASLHLPVLNAPFGEAYYALLAEAAGKGEHLIGNAKPLSFVLKQDLSDKPEVQAWAKEQLEGDTRREGIEAELVKVIGDELADEVEGQMLRSNEGIDAAILEQELEEILQTFKDKAEIIKGHFDHASAVRSEIDKVVGNVSRKARADYRADKAAKEAVEEAAKAAAEAAQAAAEVAAATPVDTKKRSHQARRRIEKKARGQPKGHRSAVMRGACRFIRKNKAQFFRSGMKAAALSAGVGFVEAGNFGLALSGALKVGDTRIGLNFNNGQREAPAGSPGANRAEKEAGFKESLRQKANAPQEHALHERGVRVAEKQAAAHERKAAARAEREQAAEQQTTAPLYDAPVSEGKHEVDPPQQVAAVSAAAPSSVPSLASQHNRSFDIGASETSYGLVADNDRPSGLTKAKPLFNPLQFLQGNLPISMGGEDYLYGEVTFDLPFTKSPSKRTRIWNADSKTVPRSIHPGRAIHMLGGCIEEGLAFASEEARWFAKRYPTIANLAKKGAIVFGEGMHATFQAAAMNRFQILQDIGDLTWQSTIASVDVQRIFEPSDRLAHKAEDILSYPEHYINHKVDAGEWTEQQGVVGSTLVLAAGMLSPRKFMPKCLFSGAAVETLPMAVNQSRLIHSAPFEVPRAALHDFHIRNRIIAQSPKAELGYSLDLMRDLGYPKDAYFSRTIRSEVKDRLLAGKAIELGGDTIPGFPQGPGFIGSAAETRLMTTSREYKRRMGLNYEPEYVIEFQLKDPAKVFHIIEHSDPQFVRGGKTAQGFHEWNFEGLTSTDMLNWRIVKLHKGD